MELVLLNKYFDLTDLQKNQFNKLFDLYTMWNQKINLISRKDIENLEERHFLHSMAIAKFIKFKEGAEVLDLGCGGGFPGLMLALLFPKTQFYLIDARNKKIMVVNDIVDQMNLNNVKAVHGRAEEIKDKKFDFVVTRAVAKIDQLKSWTSKLIKPKEIHSIPNGIIALKGNLDLEKKLLSKSDYHESVNLSMFFKEDFFKEKHLLYVQH